METDLKSYRSEFVPVSCNQGLNPHFEQNIMTRIQGKETFRKKAGKRPGREDRVVVLHHVVVRPLTKNR